MKIKAIVSRMKSILSNLLWLPNRSDQVPPPTIVILKEKFNSKITMKIEKIYIYIYIHIYIYIYIYMNSIR